MSAEVTPLDLLFGFELNPAFKEKLDTAAKRGRVPPDEAKVLYREIQKFWMGQHYPDFMVSAVIATLRKNRSEEDGLRVYFVCAEMLQCRTLFRILSDQKHPLHDCARHWEEAVIDRLKQAEQ